MEDTAPTPSLLTESVQQASPPPMEPKSKLIYILVVVAVCLGIAALVAYFLLFNKPDKTSEQTSTPSRATGSAQPEEKKEEEASGEFGYVMAAEGLNLRKEASLTSPVLLILPNKTEVEIINDQGDWYFVQAQTRGFVAKEFVSKQKPQGTTLKVYKEEDSPFNFLYPDNYQVKFSKTDTSFEYNFTGNQSLGGFKVETEENKPTIGNYALTNYPTYTKTTCDTKVLVERKECEKLTGESGTIYLVLAETTLYKFTYLKTEGGLLTDLNNLVFPLMVLK